MGREPHIWNMQLSQYKEDYLRLIQRAETYGLIDDDDAKSNFTKKELMDLFPEPLKFHHNMQVKNRVCKILCKDVDPYPTDIEVEYEQLMLYMKHSDTIAELITRHAPKNARVNQASQAASTKQAQGKGPPVKGPAVINTAHASAHKSLKAKIDREASANKHGSNSSSES